MELAHNCQINFNALENEGIDVFIFTPELSIESNIKSKFHHEAEKKIAFCKTQSIDSISVSTLEALKEYECVNLNESFNEQIEDVLTKTLHSLSKNEINILIDYTCMPSIWYSSIISYFVENDPELYKVQLFFSYSQSLGTSEAKKNKRRYDSLRVPPSPIEHRNRPTALVLGLGQEKLQKQDLNYDVEASETFAFFPDPSGDMAYSNTLIRNNTKILKQIKNEKLYKYPVSNTEMTYSLLSSVCLDLRLDHKVVIAPMGPKPFSLNCHLLAAQYPDIQVLSDLNAENGTPDGREFQGECIINKVVFCNPEDWDKF
ncbi:MAG: hypothetical protein JXB49_37630 [Bacteroidales bacterium]|nr:hypothetical protein [Bacteroidales bacterium]